MDRLLRHMLISTAELDLLLAFVWSKSIVAHYRTWKARIMCQDTTEGPEGTATFKCQRKTLKKQWKHFYPVDCELHIILAIIMWITLFHMFLFTSEQKIQMHSYSKFWLYAPLIRGKSEHYSFSGATNQALYCAHVYVVFYMWSWTTGDHIFFSGL